MALLRSALIFSRFDVVSVWWMLAFRGRLCINLAGEKWPVVTTYSARAFVLKIFMALKRMMVLLVSCSKSSRFPCVKDPFQLFFGWYFYVLKQQGCVILEASDSAGFQGHQVPINSHSVRSFDDDFPISNAWCSRVERALNWLRG